MVSFLGEAADLNLFAKPSSCKNRAWREEGGGGREAHPSSLAMTLVFAPVFSPRGQGTVALIHPNRREGNLATSVWSVVTCFSTRANKIEGGVAVAFPFWWVWSANPFRLLRGLHKQEKCGTSGWVSVIRFLRCQQRQKISFFVSGQPPFLDFSLLPSSGCSSYSFTPLPS